MSACCQAAGDRPTLPWVRSVKEMIAWLVPSRLLLLMPKCPGCLAAHLALWTGLGISLSAATYLRSALLIALHRVLAVPNRPALA